MEWFGDGMLSLRDVLRLILISALFCLTCAFTFRSNAPSMRLLLLTGMVILMLLPGLVPFLDITWAIPVSQLPPVSLDTRLPDVFLVLWLTVAAGLLLKFLINARAELRSLRNLPPPPTEHRTTLSGHLQQIAQALHCTTPQLKYGDCASSSSLAGGIVVLPIGAEHWPTKVLHAVLAHEVVHIKRRDDRWLLISHCLVLLYWWMPWIRYLRRRYIKAMEESCDDHASAYLGEPVAYATALAGEVLASNLVRDAGCIHQPEAPTGPITAMHAHHLTHRISRFSGLRDVHIESRGLYWCTVLIIVLAIGLTSVKPVSRPVAPTVYPTYNTLNTQPPDIDNPARVYSRLSLTNVSRTFELNIPQILHERRAIYPGAALRAGSEGDVLVEFTVNRDGTVSYPRIVSSKPAGVFDDAAIRAVQATRFAPFYTQTSKHATLPPVHMRRLTLLRRFEFRLSDRLTNTLDRQPGLMTPGE